MSYLSPEEIENLSRLMMSEDDSNLELAFAILEGNADRIPNFYRELVLIQELHDNHQYKETASNLLKLHYSQRMIGKWTKAFKLFAEINSFSSDTKRLQELIAAQEAFRPKIQHFVENKSVFAYHYYKVGRRLHLDIKAHLKLAEAYYRIRLNASPRDEYNLYCLAYLLADYKESAQEAIQLYEQVIAVNPTSDGAYNNIGHIHDKHYSNYKVAKGYYQKALDLAPKDTRYMRNLSKVYTYLKEENYKEKAKELIENAIKQEPRIALNWKHLGDYYWNEEKNYEESKKAYMEGIKLNPDDALLVSNLGELYSGVFKMHDMAIPCFKKAVKLEPTTYSLAYLIGLLVNEFKEFKEGRKYYEMFLKASDYQITRPNYMDNTRWDNFLKARKSLLEEFPDLGY